MKKPSKSATNLKDLIKHAIHDHEITPDEYRKIMDCAHEDGQVDTEEKALLSQFQSMISDGTIKRVKGQNAIRTKNNYNKQEIKGHNLSSNLFNYYVVSSQYSKQHTVLTTGEVIKMLR